ncbi:MAG: hypothetical protein SGARI_005028 [Bacillariaceae sp.]
MRGFDPPIFSSFALRWGKKRAAICFWGNGGSPVYLALYMTTKDKTAEHIGMDVNLDCFTNPPKASHIDFSKIVTIPQKYTLDDVDTYGTDTSKPFWNQGLPVNIKPEMYGNLRNKIINKLCRICQANPHFEYFDYTLVQDFGTEFLGRFYDAEGDMCYFRGVYQGPDTPIRPHLPIEAFGESSASLADTEPTSGSLTASGRELETEENSEELAPNRESETKENSEDFAEEYAAEEVALLQAGSSFAESALTSESWMASHWETGSEDEDDCGSV